MLMLWLSPTSLLTVASAQEPAATLPASAPKVTAVGSQTLRSLQQVDALLADELWDEALDVIEQVLVEPSSAVIAADENALPGHYVSLRQHCHARLAALPAEALEIYRQRVDPAARELYEQGRDQRDELALQQLTSEYFCSRWGDDALQLLGEIALERGDSTTARRYWQQISPQLTDPLGRSLAWSLHGIDLKEQGEAIAKLIADAPAVPGTLVYPDSDLPVSPLLARLVVAELYDDNVAAAERLTLLLRAMAPEATGTIAGREGKLVALLDNLTIAAKKTVSQNRQTIAPLYGRLWPQPVALTPPVRVPQRNQLVVDPFGRLRAAPAAKQPEALPTTMPAIAGRTVIVRDASKLLAYDLLTGEPALNRTGTLYEPVAEQRNNGRARPRVFIAGRMQQVGRQGNLPTQETLTIDDGKLYARVWQPSDGEQPAGPQIMAFDLRREGLESPLVSPLKAPWQIGGPATVSRNRLFVPLVAKDARPRLAMACYSAATGREIWRAEIASAGATDVVGANPFAAAVIATPQVELTLAEETLYLNTNFGAVAAVDARLGEIRWLQFYDRREDLTAAANNAAPALVHDGRLLVAPSDSDSVFALDAATGLPLWSAEQVEGDRQLLGVHQQTLVVGGSQLRGFDIDTGTQRYRWPESPKAGIRGMGQGCMVAGEIFWPTRSRLFVCDATTGTPKRPSVNLADLGEAGANVIPASGVLVVAGSKAMTVLGPIDREQKNNGPQISTNQTMEHRLKRIGKIGND